jgi:hypothetical protein
MLATTFFYVAALAKANKICSIKTMTHGQCQDATKFCRHKLTTNLSMGKEKQDYEGPEKTTRGRVNVSQSKFLIGT